MRNAAVSFAVTSFVGLVSCSTSPVETDEEPSTVEILAAGNPAANLDQCANGPLSSPVRCADAAWQNGNLNENQAHFFEGESIPYRLRLSSLPVGTSHVVRIEWDTTQYQSSKVNHALDYVTSYDRTETDAEPCSGIAGCTSWTTSHWPIPIDANVTAGPDGSIGTADDNITQVPGDFWLFGGTITGVSAYTVSGSYDGTSQTAISISFTSLVAQPVLAWGGHVSLRVEWAPEPTATAIPGAPYHMRLLDLDGSGGNQDRSLSAAAVHEPPTLYVIKNVVNGYGGTAVSGDFTMQVTGDAPAPSSFAGATSPGTMVEFGLSGGSYEVAETAVQGYEASYSADCSGTLAIDEVKTCTVTNTQVSLCIGVVCDPPPGDCFEAGVCDTTTGQCTYAPKLAGTACGDPSDSVCDNPNTCDGAGVCQSNNEPATTQCRADAGECDVAEYCDGAGSCPANGYETTGTACGNAADSICDNPDTCDASGTCQPNFEPIVVLCREDAGECDMPEYCDGAGSCPANAYEPSGTACGNPADSICDNPDTCTGTGVCQSNFEPAVVLCRSDAGECDVPEYCDGAGSCPANGYEPSGTACGNPSNTICDNPDTCTGSGECVVNHEPTTSLCREDTGDCDVPEYCDAAGECPANGFEPSGTACGNPADSICDNPDTCTGAGECVVNHEPVTLLCREDGGECDVPEYCDAAGECPANGFEASGTACGDPSDTICDNPDACTGTGECVVNHEPVTVLCREDAGECDVPEYCDAAGACPANGFEVFGTACGSPTDTACDNPDTCDATGDCLSNYESAGTLCRPLAGECDVAESCDAAGSCAPDAFQAAGTVCRASVDACDPSEECTGTAAGCPTDVAATCTVCGWKFYDANVNGLFDPDEDGVDGWEFLLTKDGDGLQTATSGSTGNFEFSSVSEGDFTLCENYSVGSWHQTTPVANGGCFTVHVPSDEAQSCEFDFGNVCLGAGGGHTIGFWSNRNGQIAFNLGSSSLARLVGLNLVNANGTAFDPSSYTAYKNWLNKATATNMAYMLSAQLSAMALNVQKGYVDPDALVYAPGTTTANALGYTTIDALLVEANTELGLHPLTLYGSAYRSYQEALKNALNNANTNTAFVQPGACSISFALVTRFAAAFRLALGTAIDTATVTDAFDVGADDLTIAP